jgi:hypothetical protein
MPVKADLRARFFICAGLSVRVENISGAAYPTAAMR